MNDDAIRRLRDDIRTRFPISAVAGASLELVRKGGELQACCPFHADRTPSFSIFAGDRRWICFGACQAQGDVIDFVMRASHVGFLEAIRMLDSGSLPVVTAANPLPEKDCAERRERALAIWRAAAPVVGTPAETYLRSRSIISAIPESLRFARLAYGKEGALHPALVALVASADNRAIGIQRTYLNAAGTGKAAVSKPKLSLGQVRGGAIRLAPCAARMIVCEGLEDGLTLQQELGSAVWVAVGAGMLPAMQFPAGVSHVTIGADDDDAGKHAAQSAVTAFERRGCQARIIRPVDAKDFNQELMERAR